MKVLLSIKPKYAEKIFDGSKKYEFRRTIFKCPDIKKIIVYASSPVQKVIGEFEVDNIINEDIETLWKKTHSQSGISKDFFLSYFVNKEEGYAIKIKNVKRFNKPLNLLKVYNVLPPQSFVYIK
ncbi:MAG: hypothetical protein HGB12_04045 [Bacteroidetes bacterium]|nr:hypothetical protein [Bacteroidota bacterium]